MQATQSDAFLGSTLRARLFFPLTVLSVTHLEQLNIIPSALPDEKSDSGSGYLISVNRP